VFADSPVQSHNVRCLLPIQVQYLLTYLRESPCKFNLGDINFAWLNLIWVLGEFIIVFQVLSWWDIALIERTRGADVAIFLPLVLLVAQL
jgi:hypothetical protein